MDAHTLAVEDSIDAHNGALGAPSLAPPPPPRRTRPPPVKPKGTIFLVDDDEALRRATHRLLQACGFEVRTFASAEDFLRVFDRDEPGCILLDLRMQGLSGLELQQLLLDRGTSPPIVFFTGHADDAAREHALDKGAVAFLKKPVREENLIEALERALAKDAKERGGDRGSASMHAAR